MTFIEKNPLALELIKRNISICLPAASASTSAPLSRISPPEPDNPFAISIIQHDLRKGLPLKTFDKMHLSSFDLVFLDPPYSTGLCQHLLIDWDNHNRLAPEGLLIAEERSTETLKDRFSTLRLVDKRTYGETGFWIYQNTITN